MFMRRRPLLRAAVVGGGAYVAGKRRAQLSTEQAQQEAGRDARSGSVPAQPGPAEPLMTDQLARLSQLHQQGALTDAEFAAAKAQLIGGLSGFHGPPWVSTAVVPRVNLRQHSGLELAARHPRG